MRYSKIDVEIEDIMWFGVDTNGYIFACTSAGFANVPEFVCSNREKNELLCDFFTETLSETTFEILNSNYENNFLMNDSISLARKGIFCFDAVIDDTNHIGEYIKLVSPVKPLLYEDLPEYIKSIICNHSVDIDISSTTFLSVAHAY
jgi:hypothetical protein